jgi:hypothetical protein
MSQARAILKCDSDLRATKEVNTERQSSSALYLQKGVAKGMQKYADKFSIRNLIGKNTRVERT